MIRERRYLRSTGFTIVELMVVVAVIAILAAISYVGYVNTQDRARASVLGSDLSSAAELLNTDKVRNSSFPENMSDADRGNGLPASDGTNYQYTVDNVAVPPTFCLTGINGSIAMYVTENTTPKSGVCPGHAEPDVGGSGE